MKSIVIGGTTVTLIERKCSVCGTGKFRCMEGSNQKTCSEICQVVEIQRRPRRGRRHRWTNENPFTVNSRRHDHHDDLSPDDILDL